MIVFCKQGQFLMKPLFRSRLELEQEVTLLQNETVCKTNIFIYILF